MYNTQAYIVSAFLILGSAMWASIFAPNITAVIMLLVILSILAGYYILPNMSGACYSASVPICFFNFNSTPKIYRYKCL